MSDRKQYTGLRGSGVPVIGDRQAQLQAAIGQKIQETALEIFKRAAADWMASAEKYPSAGDYGVLAEQCQTAALAYFESLGVIERPNGLAKPEETTETAS